MKKIWISTTLLLALCLVPAFSLDLTADEAVDLALQNNLSLQSAAVDLQTAKDADAVSWNGFLPAVQVSETLYRANEATPYQQMPLTTSLNGSISFSFNFNPAMITNMELARQQYLAGQISYEQAKAQTDRDVRKLFYAILLQQKSLELQQQTLENAKARMEQAQMLYDQGYTTELNLLQAQVSYENLKATTKKSEQAVAQQLANFAFLLHLDEGEELRLVGEIEPQFKQIEIDRCLAKIGARYDIEGLLRQKEILSVQREAIDRQIFIPSVSVGFTYQPTLSDVTADWFDNDNWSDGGSSTLTVSWNLTNLLPWSASRQNAKVLEDNRRKLDLQLSMLRENARLEIKTLVDTLEQSKEAIEASEHSIALAQKSYEMTVAAYEAGTRELLDVKESENQLNQAKLGKLNEQYNYLSALLDLEYATQTTF